VLKRDQKIQLIEEKRATFLVIRTVLFGLTVFAAALVGISVVVFSLVHGTMGS
jgi:hypothetical protein